MPTNFRVANDPRNGDPVHQDTVDILRSEVALLEQELAERDARVAELSAQVAGTVPRGDESTEQAPDTLALVSRLEQLLDELDRKDQREASLQETLRAAEEASRAEQEERQQIEAWLGEIEERVGQRETEWQAANDELRQRLDVVATERDRAERALTAGSAGKQHGALPPEVLTGLRQQVAELQQKLYDKEKDEASLRERLAKAEAGASAAATKAPLDKTLREERLQLAHERAELARQRAELEHDRRGLNRGPSEVDQRVQALRDHLREIHERQLVEQKERQQHSLSGRIARLWKRLEGSA
jgi:chromosome segregation ATPase